jgi:hypothetical protein
MVWKYTWRNNPGMGETGPCADCTDRDGSEAIWPDYPPLHPNCYCDVDSEWHDETNKDAFDMFSEFRFGNELTDI